MKWVHWGFLLAIGALGCVWLCEYAWVQKETAEDNAYYQKEVAPSVEAMKRNPYQLPNFKASDRWMEKLAVRNYDAKVRDDTLLLLMAVGGAGLVMVAAQAFAARLDWESPDRKAVAGAGTLLAGFTRDEGVMVARQGGANEPEVEFDARRRVVTFRNLAFTVAFIGNPVRERVEVPFSDLIVGTIIAAKGTLSLKLRTAQGTVTFDNRMNEFSKLAALISDACEQNRLNQEQFQDALAREPKIRTPWYGWAILVVSVISVIAAFWWFIVRN
jgi:hypothetical protein